MEARLRRFDSAMRWHLIRALPVLDEQGAVTCWLGTATDVNEMKETSDRAASSSRLTTELTRVAQSAGARLHAMARLRARLDASRVTLAEIDEEHDEAIVLRQAEGDELRSKWRACRTSISRASRPIHGSGSPPSCAMRGATFAPTSVYGSIYELQNVNAFISAPLLHGGSLVALLSAVQERPRDWTESEVELVNALPTSSGRRWRRRARTGASP